tara:strand:- start:67 stop:318 length:252 start_codon:yes stop_codon:yes gene_type:complete
MRKLAIEALRHKYTAEMADAEFVLSIYLKRAVGVGEHPGLLEEMDVALEKWVNANDKMNALAALTMETDDAEEEESAVVIGVD